MTDKAVSWIKQVHALTPDRPFFMYWTLAPPMVRITFSRSEWADKYKGKFDEGWDVMRERVFARQKELGWIPKDTELTPRPKTLAAMGRYSRGRKAISASAHGVFAGYTEHADAQAGRLIDTPRRTRHPRQQPHLLHLGRQRLERRRSERHHQRTPGAEWHSFRDEGSPPHSERAGRPGRARIAQGRQHVPCRLGLGWLSRLSVHKADRRAFLRRNAHADGGFLAEQGSSRTRHRIRSSIMSTISCRRFTTSCKSPAEACRWRHPGSARRHQHGPFLRGANSTGHKKEQYFEVMGSRAIYKDEWIASVFGPRASLEGRSRSGDQRNGRLRTTCGTLRSSKDFSQAKDIASANPKKVEEMKKTFDANAKANKALSCRRRPGGPCCLPSRRRAIQSGQGVRLYAGSRCRSGVHRTEISGHEAALSPSTQN